MEKLALRVEVISLKFRINSSFLFVNLLGVWLATVAVSPLQESLQSSVMLIKRISNDKSEDVPLCL